MIEKIKLICEKIRLMESKIITTDHAFPNLAVWLEEVYNEELISPVEVILDHWEIWVVAHVHDAEDQHGRAFYKRLNKFMSDVYKFKIKQIRDKIWGYFQK